MVTRTQIDHLARRIDALDRRGSANRPRIGVIFRHDGETVKEAMDRHLRFYPEDDVANMLVIGWEPMTAAEWEEKYCVPNRPTAG